MAEPDIVEKTPTQNMSVNKPESGTYGERAETDRLKKELPSSGGPVQGQQQAPPRAQATPNRPPENMPIPEEAGPKGVPNVLMHEGKGLNPLMPSTGGVMAGPENTAQARMALLDSLANSREVSEETREWAQIVLGMLLDGSRS